LSPISFPPPVKLNSKKYGRFGIAEDQFEPQVLLEANPLPERSPSLADKPLVLRAYGRT